MVATWISGSEPTCQPGHELEVNSLLHRLLESLAEHTFQEESFRSLKESYFTLGGCDGVELAVSIKPVSGVVRVEDRAKYSR